MRGLYTVMLFFPLLAFGGNTDRPTSAEKLRHYLSAFIQADRASTSAEEFEKFIDKLAEKKAIGRNQQAFIGYLFDKTHRRFLRSYSEYASFSQTLDNGVYNCLTGTALYALLLDHFGIDYQIIETNYHIFLLATTGSGRVLIEATDPENGFVEDDAKIDERIQQYRQNGVRKSDKSKEYYQYSSSLYKQVSIDEMLGLLHYNLSVVAYNSKDLKGAIYHLNEAVQLYQSPRTEEFARILLLTVTESKLDASARQEFIQKMQVILKVQFNLSARSSL